MICYGIIILSDVSDGSDTTVSELMSTTQRRRTVYNKQDTKRNYSSITN